MPGCRPRIEIDWADFDRLCEVQCTLAAGRPESPSASEEGYFVKPL